MSRRLVVALIILALVAGATMLLARRDEKPWACFYCPPPKPMCIPYCPQATPIVYVRDPPQ